MARPAGVARRHEPALVLQKRQGRVHPAVEPLRVRPARDRARRDSSPPRVLLQAVGLRAAPAVEQPLAVARKERGGVYAARLEGFTARRRGPQEPHVVVEALALAREGEQRAVWGPHRIRRLRGWARVAERGRRTVRRHGPNLGMSAVLVLDNRRHDEGDAPPVGRDARVAESGEAVGVRRLKGMAGRLGGQTGRRTGGQKADRDWRQPTGGSVVLQGVGGGGKYVLGGRDPAGGAPRRPPRPPVAPPPP